MFLISFSQELEAEMENVWKKQTDIFKQKYKSLKRASKTGLTEETVEDEPTTPTTPVFDCSNLS